MLKAIDSHPSMQHTSVRCLRILGIDAGSGSPCGGHCGQAVRSNCHVPVLLVGSEPPGVDDVPTPWPDVHVEPAACPHVSKYVCTENMFFNQRSSPKRTSPVCSDAELSLH
mmetsp:Transcript_135714/g.302093  ORF Transcript_135714/g.302093 Transcript_135714/m.302093 type:complete len:111 (+) Transcript_135714:88-420(+)